MIEFPLTFVALEWRDGSLTAIHRIIVQDWDENDSMMAFGVEERGKLSTAHPAQIPVRFQIKMLDDYLSDRGVVRKMITKSTIDRHEKLPNFAFPSLATFYSHVGYHPKAVTIS